MKTEKTFKERFEEYKQEEHEIMEESVKLLGGSLREGVLLGICVNLFMDYPKKADTHPSVLSLRGKPLELYNRTKENVTRLEALKKEDLEETIRLQEKSVCGYNSDMIQGVAKIKGLGNDIRFGPRGFDFSKTPAEAKNVKSDEKIDEN